MAKIKGVEIKNIVNFRGHEEEPLQQGDIYFYGKKIGFYSDCTFGGDSIVNIYNLEEDKIINDIANDYFEKHKQDPRVVDVIDFIDKKSVFFEEILKLQELERLFKKALKKGGVGILECYKKSNYENEIYTCYKTFDYSKWCKEEKPYFSKYYTSLADFIIK